MGSWKQGVIAGLAAALIAGAAWGGGIFLFRQTNAMAWFSPQPKPVKLRPVVDEKGATENQPLSQVWKHYVKNVRFYSEAFDDVLRSRLRHRRFQDLETYAREIRSTKARQVGGKWLLQNLYEALDEPSEGRDAATDQWEAHLALLDEWRKTVPESITANVAYAEAMTSYAFVGRGDSFAPKVTDAQWKVFNERLAMAEEVLVAASEFDQKCPGWFGAMQDVALGQSWNRKDRMTLFNQAVGFEPAYATYYSSLAVYLLPRWHGEEGEWPAVLAEITDQQGTDEAHSLYYGTFSYVLLHYYEYDEAAPFIKKFWPQIKRGYHARQKLFNVTFSEMNDIARMAYIVGDREEARSAFKNMSDHKNLELWEKDQALFDKAKKWANENGSALQTTPR